MKRASSNEQYWGALARGLHSNIFVPPDRDEAIMELWFGDREWAELELEGIDPDANGEARLAGATVIVHLCQPRRGGELTSWQFEFDEAPAQLERAARRRWWWGFEAADAMAELRRAREKLLAHERGR